MSDDRQPHNLGRGLSALFQDEGEDYASLDQVRQTKTVPVEFLTPGRFQPRHRFDAGDMESLVASIRERGVLQPILVRRSPDSASSFEIVAGERRWRAAQLAQLHEVPVLVREFSDEEALEVALVENIQRADLTVIEEARGYQRLVEEFGYTNQTLGQAVGKSRSHIANMIRLLDLPAPVQEMVEDGRLSAGHARALIGAADPLALAQKVAKRGLNVRQTEALARAEKQPAKARPAPTPKDVDTARLERNLSQLLGLKVAIELRGEGGVLSIRYDTLDQLDDVLHRLQGRPATASSS
ncbi:MAG: ParB/RepB/Spo0J family partition protein [Alphaproteobacteria bacterium]|nr:ParB/RepB/Spo0J family partition protein [Alphaproteobacteria bacterium]